ncbi:MAG: hypothetical protein GX868_16210 [Actinobacteria bacterium]|nr:hypothetical protein [Actinomycetota bacterium]
MDYYLPFRLIGLGCFALLGWTTWRYGRSVTNPVVALLATAAILWNEGGVTNVLFPFLLNFSLPLAALAAIWWHLDHDTTRHDVAASVWLAVAMATSGLGLMVAVAVGVELLWNRAPRRRFAIMAPGPALWVLWYLRYGESETRSDDVMAVAKYAVRMLVAGGSSLVGGVAPLGVVVCAAVAALAVVCAVRGVLLGRAVGALCAPLVFVALTAWSRIGIQPEIPPDELRYRWAVGGFLVLAVLAMIAALGDTTPNQGVTPSAGGAHDGDCDGAGDEGDGVGDSRAQAAQPATPGSFTSTGRATPLRVGAVAVCVVALVVNAVQLHRDALDWADRVETAAPGLRANLWVAEQAGAAGVIDRDWWMPLSFVRFTAGEYLDAVARIGSPLDPYTADEIGGVAEQTGPANVAFVDMFDLKLEPASSSVPSSCAPLASGTAVTVVFGTTLLLSSTVDAEVFLDLFDVAEHAAPVGVVRAGQPALLEIAEATGYSQITALTLRFSAPVEAARCT